MTTRQALILFAGVVLIAVFLVVSLIDPGFGGGGSGAEWRPLMYILAGVSAAGAWILAFSPWGRREG